mmetsp:Transcript_32049/g.90147  ORF Transcript_32049/g.90147 Transcript_32049/m.90147 type:complete len:240 (-) Transcript_32049:696-1415(-)
MAPERMAKDFMSCSEASSACASSELPGRAVPSVQRARWSTSISPWKDASIIAGSSGAISVTCGFVFTFFTLSANRRVLRLSSASDCAGETLASMVVSEFPLRASMRMCVSFDCRNGTCTPFPAPAASLEMTCPRTERLLLMLEPSRIRWPTAPLFFTRSLPARSQRFTLEFRIFPLGKTCVTLSVRTEWEREEVEFMFVCAVARTFAPKSISLLHSLQDDAAASVRCGTCTPSFGCWCT